jgi:hypothetical protein
VGLWRSSVNAARRSGNVSYDGRAGFWFFVPSAPPLEQSAAMNTSRSHELFTEALKFIPGGVNSPVRAFRNVGGEPFFVNRAEGSHIWDVDGNEYID